MPFLSTFIFSAVLGLSSLAPPDTNSLGMRMVTVPAGKFVMGRGYLAAAQTPDNVIHLVSSHQHYRFTLPWLREKAAVPKPQEQAKNDF